MEQLGFHFSDPDIEIAWDKEENSERPDVPLLKDGILYSAGRSKGKVFAEYISKIGKKFSQVVFIDDQHQNLLDVSAEAARLGMSCLGFYYTGAISPPGVLDRDVAKHQMEHFKKTSTWLSADEAAEQIRRAQFY